MNIVLVDGDAPWVRSLFRAMPADVTVHALRPKGLAAFSRHPVRSIVDSRWRLIKTRYWERSVLIPSWSKAPRLTTAVVGRAVGRRLATLGCESVLVYTLPFYSGLPGRLPEVPSVYFAYDPYACYSGWNPDAVHVGEQHMFAKCDGLFAISPALADDFRRQTDRPVFVQPNGVSESFIAAFDKPLPPPDDLPAGGPPVVGCIGQISKAYDWDLLESVIRLCPNLDFVFVGPKFDEGPAERARIDRVFATANVHWLGAKQHTEVPRYIHRFDVCLNPLRVDPCTDRRSLLRLYDYLASDRGVVSTPVAPALEHRTFVDVGRDAAEIADLLHRRTTEKPAATDVVARREYIRRHTWERRAETFLTNLKSLPACRRL